MDMDKYVVMNEVYKKRRTLLKQKYYHECRYKTLEKLNISFLMAEILLLPLLFLTLGAAWGEGQFSERILLNIAALSALLFVVLSLIRQVFGIEKEAASEKLKAELHSRALVKIDQQIALYQLQETPKERQLERLETFFLLDGLDNISTEKWNQIGWLIEQNKLARAGIEKNKTS